MKKATITVNTNVQSSQTHKIYYKSVTKKSVRISDLHDTLQSLVESNAHTQYWSVTLDDVYELNVQSVSSDNYEDLVVALDEIVPAWRSQPSIKANYVQAVDDNTTTDNKLSGYFNFNDAYVSDPCAADCKCVTTCKKLRPINKADVTELKDMVEEAKERYTSLPEAKQRNYTTFKEGNWVGDGILAVKPGKTPRDTLITLDGTIVNGVTQCSIGYDAEEGHTTITIKALVNIV